MSTAVKHSWYKPKRAIDYHDCPHCAGKGKLELTGVYAETLRGVRRLLQYDESYLVAAAYAKWFGCKETALNNRLKRLEELGFLTSEKYGRERRFKLAPRATT